MHVETPETANRMELIQDTLGAPLKPGELGVLLARAGVGKSACLTHIALENLLRGIPVLHVCIDEVPDTIKVWYHEFLKNLARSSAGEDFTSLQYRIEPLRFILAYLHQSFNPDKLEQSLQNLKDQANFHPSMVVMDGLNFDKVSRQEIEALKHFAEKQGVSVWMSARTHQHISDVNERGIPYPCHQMDDLFHSIVLLEPVPSAIRVKVLKHVDHYKPEHPPVLLDPQTFLIQKG
jgi:hypothetical protein